MVGNLLSAAIVIALVGFMEAISIAKAMAAKTKQKIDPNQELLGQGLANLVGACSQAFPVSGSFSRSAVNIGAGARSGLSSVFTGLFVLLTLLLLTPLLYHLPQAVLAAVIIMAVIGLINFGAIKHAWQANRHDGIASIVTFIATLAFAPHLDNGILVGAGLAIVLYLYRTMQPRVAILGRFHDGTLRDAKVNNLPPSEVVTAVRFDGRLYFANVSYFEDTILEAVANNPKASYLLVVGDAINEIDASGEEVMHQVVERRFLRPEETGARRAARHRADRNHRPAEHPRHGRTGARRHLRALRRQRGCTAPRNPKLTAGRARPRYAEYAAVAAGVRRGGHRRRAAQPHRAGLATGRAGQPQRAAACPRPAGAFRQQQGERAVFRDPCLERAHGHQLFVRRRWPGASMAWR